MRNPNNACDRSVWKGAAAGLLGGLVASWVMNQFQSAVSQLSDGSSGQQESGDDATMKAADAVADTVAGRHLTHEEKQALGPFVHYAFGSSIGALYGAVAELVPQTTTAWGMPFGVAVWLGADEIAVPAFGLSKAPFEYPASTHASALAAHLVYGVTTDIVRRVLR
jgi:putative membrane protein